MKWLHSTTISVDMSLSRLQEIVKDTSLVSCSPWGHKELDMTEQLKNRCFRTVVLEKMLENPLDCKEIKPVNPKGNQP